ncbi:MAG: hypothetical protein LJE67_10195 [Salaquimonas sp.]|jgi:hypothetical protein|nr:hypothetical protein [Salaquimonas sp.]
MQTASSQVESDNPHYYFIAMKRNALSGVMIATVVAVQGNYVLVESIKVVRPDLDFSIGESKLTIPNRIDTAALVTPDYGDTGDLEPMLR